MSLKTAGNVVKRVMGVPRAIVKHRRKIVGGAMAAGVGLSALAKKDPRKAVSLMKGVAKAGHAVQRGVAAAKSFGRAVQ